MKTRGIRHTEVAIAIVACLYIAMNVSVLGILPAADIAAMAGSTSQNSVVARAAQAAYGNWAGTLVALLVIWTAFASVFSLLAGYSRIPFAGKGNDRDVILVFHFRWEMNNRH